jgi:hypothetical protein
LFFASWHTKQWLQKALAVVNPWNSCKQVPRLECPPDTRKNLPDLKRVCPAHAESMQNQGRWRKSVRTIIAVNSMRPASRKPPSAAAVDEEQEELEEPPPGAA